MDPDLRLVGVMIVPRSWSDETIWHWQTCNPDHIGMYSFDGEVGTLWYYMY